MKLGCVIWFILLSLMCGKVGLAQEINPNELPATPAVQDASVSSSESNADFLSRAIGPPPSNELTTGSWKMFQDPETKASAIKTGATLTLVISLFLLVVFIWRLRPAAGRAPQKKGKNEVLTVLGQIPFVHGQQLQLVRLGTRLLLVAASPSGSQTLSEISDPHEVLQLESAFQQGRMDLLTAAMQQRALQNNAPSPGVSLGSQQRTGRTLLEA